MAVGQFFAIQMKFKEKMYSDALERNTVLESISDGVFTIDLKCRITSFNLAAEEITGGLPQGNHRPELL